LPDVPPDFVPHPIQNATAEEIRVEGNAFIEQRIGALTMNKSSSLFQSV